MWRLRLCALFMATAAEAAKQGGIEVDKASKAPASKTAPSQTAASKAPASEAPASKAPESQTATPEAPTVVSMQNFLAPFFLAHEVVKESLPLDQFSLEPLREALRWGPEAGNQAYEQVATAYETHGPTVRQAVYDSMASCEGYVAEGRKLGQSMYRENLGPHLDPHAAVVQDLYGNVRGHVDAVFQMYSDVHPVLQKHASDAYDVTHASLGNAFGQLNDSLFESILPATQIGLERTFAGIRDKASVLFEPVEIVIRGKTLLFPYGVFDVVFASIHGLLLLCVGLYVAQAFCRFSARFSTRLVRTLFRWTATLTKSVFSLVYLVIVKMALGLVFFVLRVLTLNYLCKCCGLCAKRKKSVKAPLKQAESKQKAAAESKSATKKPDLTPPPSIQSNTQSKSKKKH